MVPVISVIMPVRNGTQWLREAVESVLSQEFRQFELLIIDDGSDDDAVGLLAELASTDSRVSVLRQPPKGIVAALNLGIAAAHAPYLARLDADDRVAAAHRAAFDRFQQEAVRPPGRQLEHCRYRRLEVGNQTRPDHLCLAGIVGARKLGDARLDQQGQAVTSPAVAVDPAPSPAVAPTG